MRKGRERARAICNNNKQRDGGSERGRASDSAETRMTQREGLCERKRLTARITKWRLWQRRELNDATINQSKSRRRQLQNKMHTIKYYINDRFATCITYSMDSHAEREETPEATFVVEPFWTHR